MSNISFSTTAALSCGESRCKRRAPAERSSVASSGRAAGFTARSALSRSARASFSRRRTVSIHAFVAAASR
jgi:hypothetical protein